jgi:WhiB family redox-sensing transcriptional regulator
MSASAMAAGWWEAAACRNSEPELFFPVSGSVVTADVRQAKLICASCAARVECLNFALRQRQEQGIWGGLTEEERRVLRRRLAANGRRSVRSMDLRAATGAGKSLVDR